MQEVHAIEQSAHFDVKNKIQNIDINFFKSLNFFKLKKISISIIKNKKNLKIFMQGILQNKEFIDMIFLINRLANPL